ncbi:MAG: hypothetical protein HZB50_14430 [Chloroflexi bacterium]|nr:hypothetical protein [Chloroflexota bacterium]
MLGFYIIILAIIVGGVASKGNARSAFLYIPVAGLGAIAGTFIGFGDASFIADNEFLSPLLLSLLGSLTSVAVLIFLRRGIQK